MGLFDKLFGKKVTPQQPSKSNLDTTPKLTVEDIRKEYDLDKYQEREVIEGCYLEIDNIDVESLKHELSQRIKERADKINLMSNNARKEYPNNPDLLNSIHLLPDTIFLHNLTEAKEEKKNDNNERAADLLWTNVYYNATEAPGHYKELAVVLRKLKRKDLADKISLLHDYVFSNMDKLSK